MSLISEVKKTVHILVLGSTGYTGKFVVKNLLNITRQTKYSDITFGISGRSKEKLDQLLIENQDNGTDISKIRVFQCDIDDYLSLNETVGKAQVVINCTGPNIFLSAPIVKACIANRTHYVDISAELYHMVSVYRDYHKAAEQENILIVTGCGFATIPVTTGMTYLERQLEGTLQSVECFAEVDVPKRAYFPGCDKVLVHYGTYSSMIQEMFNFRKVQELRRITYPNDILGPEPRELKKSFFHKENGRWWMPYPGPEYGVVDMSQRYILETKRKTPHHFKIYVTMPLVIHFFLLVPVFFICYLLTYFRCVQYLLLKFPRFFTLGYISHDGPSEASRNGTTYGFTLRGKALNEDKSISVKVSGIDPGYQTTSISIIASAITIIRENTKMPAGGVLTTYAAFHDTQIMDVLMENNMKFEVI